MRSYVALILSLNFFQLERIRSKKYELCFGHTNSMGDIIKMPLELTGEEVGQVACLDLNLSIIMFKVKLPTKRTANGSI